MKHDEFGFKRTSCFLGFAEGIHFDTVLFAVDGAIMKGLIVFVNPVQPSDTAEGQFKRGLGDAVIVDSGHTVQCVNHGDNPFPVFGRNEV